MCVVFFDLRGGLGVKIGRFSPLSCEKCILCTKKCEELNQNKGGLTIDFQL